MAIFHGSFFSHCLRRTVEFRAIIPLEKRDSSALQRRRLKTIYLLHGYTGYSSDWLIDSDICELAHQHDLAVVMPSGENRFYVDNPEYAFYFGEFVGRELVEFTRAMFPLSERREDTLIGGLSIGGFGAIRNGLRYPDTFGTIIALSSALITDSIVGKDVDFSRTPEPKAYYELCFGPLDKLPGSDNDPKALAKKILEQNKPIPAMYLACGTEDFLFENVMKFHEYLASIGMKPNLVTGRGQHDWKFWNPQIRAALGWYFNS